MTQTDHVPTTDFLLGDPEVAKDPGPFFEELRSKCPVVHTEAHDGFWIVSRYDDVQASATNGQLFSSAGVGGVNIPRPPAPPWVCLEQDDPEHRIYRRPLQPWFSTGRMASLEDKVREIVTRLIDPIVDDGRCDIRAVLAEPVPPVVISLLLGLPESDWPHFKALNDHLLLLASEGDLEGSGEVVQQLVAYLGEKLQERREQPTDDLLSEIVAIKVHGEPIAQADASALAFLILAAGQETTSGGVEGMLYHVAKDTSIRDRLLADPSLIPDAVEEALRLEAPVMGIGRTITAATTLAGVTMPADERVMLMLGAANRDPAVFEDPEQFKLDRKNNRHLTFGAGVHRCVGAPLARLEMRIVLEEVLRRMPGIQLESDDAVQVDYHFTRSYKQLPVTW